MHLIVSHTHETGAAMEEKLRPISTNMIQIEIHEYKTKYTCIKVSTRLQNSILTYKTQTLKNYKFTLYVPLGTNEMIHVKYSCIFGI